MEQLKLYKCSANKYVAVRINFLRPLRKTVNCTHVPQSRAASPHHESGPS